VKYELRAAWAVARKELRVTLRYPLNAANTVLQPLYQFLIPSLLLGATFLVGGRAIGLEQTAGTADLAGYLFVGIIVAGLVSTAFWEVGFGFQREIEQGTLEATWLTPTTRETFVLGRAISGLIVSGAASAILVAIGIGLFSAEVGPGVVVALPALLIAAVSLLGIGYLVGALVLLLRDPGFFVDATSFAFVTLSGVAFPVAVLPIGLEQISYLLPTTYAVDILRALALGTPPFAPMWAEWLALVGLSVLAIVVGRWAFRRTEHRVLVRGTLGMH